MINDIPPQLAARLFPNVICRGEDNAIYLTFDDGPDSAVTSKLCSKLIDLNCPATFFITTSRVESEKLLIMKLYDAGFTIGSHGYNHKSLFLASYMKVKSEVLLSKQIIEDIIGTRPTLFRPPFGRFNLNTLRVCSREKLQIVLWSLSVKDWIPSATGVLSERIISRATAGDIILLHDHGNGAENTLKEIPSIVNGLRDKGFTLKALPNISSANV
jgi:peptidoglycan/xylan/chitin deacetylase (PgdA/CDA1 family)